MQQQAIRTSQAHLRSPLGQSPQKRIFAFDLDGTITASEMLPVIARHAGCERELAELTRRTLNGAIGFEESFRTRFAMLRHIALPLVHKTVAQIPLDPHIAQFIAARRSECVIVTGNLDLWIMPILKRLGCRYFASRGAVIKDEAVLLSVLDKGAAARQLRREKFEIVAIGESTNDVPLFREASMGIAFAGVHPPVPEIRKRARFCVRDGASLCRLLKTL